MKSLLTEEGYKDIKDRLALLTENHERLWGKMTLGQMLWHCQYPLQIAVTNSPNQAKGNWFVNLFFKKSLYSDTLWRKNLPTAPQLKTKEAKDFSTEYEKLLQLVNELYAQRHRELWHPHPVFGPFTKEQWGQLQYKHMDHHLRQFGV